MWRHHSGFLDLGLDEDFAADAQWSASLLHSTLMFYPPLRSSHQTSSCPGPFHWCMVELESLCLLLLLHTVPSQPLQNMAESNSYLCFWCSFFIILEHLWQLQNWQKGTIAFFICQWGILYFSLTTNLAKLYIYINYRVRLIGFHFTNLC